MKLLQDWLTHVIYLTGVDFLKKRKPLLNVTKITFDLEFDSPLITFEAPAIRMSFHQHACSWGPQTSALLNPSFLFLALLPFQTQAEGCHFSLLRLSTGLK